MPLALFSRNLLILPYFYLVRLCVELVNGECHKHDRKHDRGVKDELFHAAAGLVISFAATAEKSGHARRTLLKKDERNNGYGKDYLDDCNYHEKSNSAATSHFIKR